MIKLSLAARISREKVVLSFRYEPESQEIQVHSRFCLQGESMTDTICSTQSCSSLGIMCFFVQPISNE